MSDWKKSTEELMKLAGLDDFDMWASDDIREAAISAMNRAIMPPDKAWHALISDTPVPAKEPRWLRRRKARTANKRL
jgi:hypothetical protein